MLISILADRPLRTSTLLSEQFLAGGGLKVQRQLKFPSETEPFTEKQTAPHNKQETIMKTTEILALMVAASIIAFTAGSGAGFGGLLIMLMTGHVLIIVAPVTAGIVAVAAAIFAVNAKTRRVKPDWRYFFNFAFALCGVALLIAVAVAWYAVSTGFC